MFFRKEIACKNCRYYKEENIDGYDYCFKQAKPVVPSKSCNFGQPITRIHYPIYLKKKLAKLLKNLTK